MSFNGSGTFNRTISWASRTGQAITTSNHDTHDDDLADGLSNCICKDGQTTITANIPFNSQKLTGLGDATAHTDACNAGQVQDGSFVWLGSTSGTNTVTGSATPAITAYVAGQLFRFTAGGSNSGAVTLNINSVGATAVTKQDGSALVSGDIVSGEEYEVLYNGSAFILLNPSMGNVEDIARLAVTDGNIIVGNGTTWVAESGATARTSLGAAASGSNSDITALSGLSLTTSWTPNGIGTGSMSISGETIHEGNWNTDGAWVHFQISISFTVGGTPSTTVQLTHPVAGTADNANVSQICAAVDGDGSDIVGARWRYDGTYIVVFPPGGANWTVGSSASIHINGKYQA